MNEKIKVYAIATKQRECYGHGDFGDEIMIKQYDAYHTPGKWYPLFRDKKDAEKYFNKLSYKTDMEIVELELI